MVVKTGMSKHFIALFKEAARNGKTESSAHLSFLSIVLLIHANVA